MKHLLTVTALLVSSLAMGQWPSLPYNPDDNADGLIGVADLQALLANYGSEFASAVVSEDGESAIVYMGYLQYPHCKYSCDHLPGFWSMPHVEDLVPVWGEVAGNPTWLKSMQNIINLTGDYTFYVPRYEYLDDFHQSTLYANSTKRCYCAAKQLPRVEYEIVGAGLSLEATEEAYATLAAAGWMYLEMDQNGRAIFWRWAE